MRFHAQTAGVSLTAQQPLNNVVRTATEALSAVLGGTQSLHTNSFDEALALPTEDAVRVALRTQQIIAHETGVTNTIDPLGGSYFVEALTDRMEEAAYDYFAQIDELGGMVEAIKQNYPQREIADAVVPATRRRSSAASGSSWASTATSRRATSRSRSCGSRRSSSASRSAAWRPCARRATREAVETRAGGAARGGGRATQPDGAAARRARGRTAPRARSWSRSSGCSGPTPRRPVF